MMRRKLSADPSSLILGIVGLVILLPGCCCGLFGVFAIILFIIGLVMAEKSLKEYGQNREYFDPQSLGNVKSGRIICIIGLVISSIIIAIYAFYFLVYGAMFSDIIKETYNKNNNYPFPVQDSIEEYQDFEYHDSVPADTLAVDTSAIHVEEVK